jgi:hypothetical protein
MAVIFSISAFRKSTGNLIVPNEKAEGKKVGQADNRVSLPFNTEN